ncbi:ABC transporter ATP-binding protein [Halococcus saccharolyticus]|uniref:Cobalamin import ATP-binding protein BtuD n=1 Tax=Halococcus saccharolyticus DSM 5350 TaxID=1227455 RepID=M0MEI8_9EURY|nr:ABC transporter ATP-binding protein [Halococcus saccharolyticus]EMA42830.1 iron/cobalamin ABC-type transporter ATP-binding protein [Halococcus saccharolyticus DSM 5350]
MDDERRTGSATTDEDERTAGSRSTSDSPRVTDGGVTAASAASEAVHRRAEADDAEPPRSALVGEDLAISYPTTEEPVVECTRVDVPEGEMTALVGPNGSGKSTLLKTLSDHLAPDGGAVALNGRAINEYGSKELARELGHLSQENDSPGSITVEDLVSHGRYPYRGTFESVDDADRAAVDRAIDLAGIDHLRDTEIGQLSGGQRQLAWIGMVLAQETDVLLLDEPTTFLDLHHQLRVMETVRRLNREEGVTVAVVLHDIAQAARFADYLIALKDGEVYDWGPPANVVTEGLLADVFGVEAVVEGTEHGPRPVPIRPLDG